MSDSTKRMEPLSDTVFSFMFSDQAMKPFLVEMINSVLSNAGDTQIEDVQEFKAQYDVQKRMIDSHGGRVDVRAKATDGALFDIEVQLKSLTSMNARSWFYGSGIMGEEFKVGMPYDQMPKVRIINILDFTLRNEHENYLQPIKMMYAKDPEEATDAFRIYNIEMPKYRAGNPTLESVKDDPLKSWLYMLDRGYESDLEMEVLGKMTEGMRAFASRYQISLTDPELQRMYDYEMSAKRDHAASILTAKNEGRAEGRAEGKTEMIRNLFANGAPLDLIYKSAGLPRAEVDAIIADLK